MVGLKLCAGALLVSAVCLGEAAAGQPERLVRCEASGPLGRLAAAPALLALADLPPEELAPPAAMERRPPVDYAATSRIAPDAAAQRIESRDLAPLRAAMAAYQRGDRVGGDLIAQRIGEPAQRIALEWIALKSSRAPDYSRLAAFGEAHPGWAGNDWIRYEQEAALLAAPPSGATIERMFAADPPRTPPGKLALARAARDAGHADQAGALVRFIWRNDPLNAWTESFVLREFAPFLSRADHSFRADKLFYAESYGAAARAAALAGGQAPAAMRARMEALRGRAMTASPASASAKPPGDPALVFAQVSALRRADRVLEAAVLLERAPREESRIIDGDRWWSEQRLIARRLLDAGLGQAAYTICRSGLAASPSARTDAEFLAGWIALRFLDRAEEAEGHFASAAGIATTPLSIARAAYWQGRAAQALNHREEARRFYQRAAQYPTAYYGQLAAQKLEASPPAPQAPPVIAVGASRDEATQVVELLYDARLDALALPLALDEARQATDQSQLAALARVLADHADALASVEVGKQASQRGFALDEAAFPTFGVPRFTPLANSADLASVYSVARQESEFVGRAASGAGARGLMQLLPSTARETARRSGLPFDFARLTGDPAFNAQIGAAFLGQLLSDEGGSPILAFAAYNAGAGRVEQWIKAYGDPRAGADPVDWVERIPFDETRDYVQRVSENLGVYRKRLGGEANEPLERVAQAREP